MTDPLDISTLAALLRSGPITTPLSAEAQQELLLMGAVAALEERAVQEERPAQEDHTAQAHAPAPSAVELLYETAAVHPLDSVRGLAFQALLRLAQAGRNPAVDALYRLAVEENSLGARQAITAGGWQPTRPALRALFDWFTCLEAGRPFPEDSLPALSAAYFAEASPSLRRRLLAGASQNRAEHWARIMAAVETGLPAGFLDLVERYPRFRPTEREILLKELSRLAEDGSPFAPAAREALALLYIRCEDDHARQILLTSAGLPEDPTQRALLFFLGGDWARYETLDFDHHLLLSAYEQSGRALRRRLLEHARHTGQMDWLRGMGGAAEVRWLEDLTDADWELAIRRLAERERPAELWQLAQVAPPLWSAAILHRLLQADWQPAWQPDDPAEREGFASLAAQARECLAAPLTIRPRKSLHAPLDEITCLALQPGGRTLAAGCGDARVFQWQLPDGDLRGPALIGPAPLTRALAYSPDGELMACASSDHRIRVFRAQTGQLVKTLEGHRAMLRGLAINPDGRALYSASFDGTLRFWRFPYGPELKTLRPGPEEIFSMALGAGGSHLLSGGADGLVRVWSLPEGAPARELEAPAGTVTHLAASPSSELVASAGRDGFLRLWNFTSGGLLRTIPNTAPLTALVMHPNDQVLAGGSTRGEVFLWNLSTGRLIDTLAAHEQPITGLVFSPEGERLYSADSGGVLRVWDLQAFLAVRLPSESSRPGAVAEIEARLVGPSLSAAEKKWLGFSAALARWRQRFDIELSSLEPIAVGEFDIEIV